MINVVFFFKFNANLVWLGEHTLTYIGNSGEEAGLRYVGGEMFGKYLIEQSGAEEKICRLGLGWNFLDNMITTSNASMDQNNNFIFLPPPFKKQSEHNKFYCDPEVCYNMSTQTCKVCDKKKLAKLWDATALKQSWTASATHNLVLRGLWWKFREYQIGNPLSR